MNSPRPTVFRLSHSEGWESAPCRWRLAEVDHLNGQRLDSVEIPRQPGQKKNNNSVQSELFINLATSSQILIVTSLITWQPSWYVANKTRPDLNKREETHNCIFSGHKKTKTARIESSVKLMTLP